MALYLLFESASGYALFHAYGIDEIGQSVDAVRSSVLDLKRFSKAVKLAGFTPFSSAIDALNQCNAISEGIMTDELRNFLELNLPKVKDGKKAKFSVGVMEPKVGSHITEATGIPCQSNEYVQELLRAVRLHFNQFIDQLKDDDDDDDLDLFGDETEEDKAAGTECAAAAKPAKKKEISRRRRTDASATPSATFNPSPAIMAETDASEYYTDEEEEVVGHEGGPGSEGEEEEGAGQKRKRPLKESVDGFSKRGVVYLSRVPPNMNPSHVRQMFSKYGEVQRIYLVPQGQGHRKHSNVHAKAYSEGWIEFTKKSVAKRVANLLNGEQIGGKKRSSFYYDIWNIKYLRKFRWDDLVGEIAEKTHIREQKLNLEITAAKKQRDHYLSNAEKSRTQKFIRERIKKKQKTEGKESNDATETKIDRPVPQQNRPVEERGPKTKPKLSKSILAGVFGSS